MAERRCPFKLITDETMEYSISKGTLDKVHKRSYFGMCEQTNCPFYINNATCWCTRKQ